MVVQRWIFFSERSQHTTLLKTCMFHISTDLQFKVFYAVEEQLQCQNINFVAAPAIISEQGKIKSQ